MKAHLDSKTGVAGVSMHKNGSYRAVRKGKHLGVFKTMEEAKQAYLDVVAKESVTEVK